MQIVDEITNQRPGPHARYIDALRTSKGFVEDNMQLLAADLLEMHDRTSLSLDEWEVARRFVREMIMQAYSHEFTSNDNLVNFVLEHELWSLPKKNGA